MPDVNDCLAVLRKVVEGVVEAVCLRGVKPLARLVENQQRRVFDDRPREQRHALFAERQSGEGGVAVVFEVEKFEGVVYFFAVRVAHVEIPAHCVEQPRRDRVPHGRAFVEVPVHFGRDYAHFFLDVPNALAASAGVAEEPDVVAVRLRVVAANEAKQCRFPRAVAPYKQPFFARLDRPRNAVEHGFFAVPHADVACVYKSFGVDFGRRFQKFGHFSLNRFDVCRGFDFVGLDYFSVGNFCEPVYGFRKLCVGSRDDDCRARRAFFVENVVATLVRN